MLRNINNTIVTENTPVTDTYLFGSVYYEYYLHNTRKQCKIDKCFCTVFISS